MWGLHLSERARLRLHAGRDKSRMRRLAFAVACSMRPLATLASLQSHAIIPSLSVIADKYDAILIDQFGVLHDGATAIPGAIDCFNNLAAAGKKLIVLSNTSRRRAFALSKLPKLGFDPAKLTGFVTSGEAAWEYMRATCAGKRVLWLSWAPNFQAWDPAYLDGLEVCLAPASECDLVLCQGSGMIRDGSAEPTPTNLLRSGELGDVTEAALAICAARGVPMICANPDLHVTLPDGSRGHMPGLLAEAYEAMGGHVVFFGKPHKQSFDECLALLPEATDPARVLHVGDSLAHDVAGANRAGLHSLFVASGIHSDELRALASRDETASESDMQMSAGLPSDTEVASDILERLFQANDCKRPTYTIAQFRW